MNKGFLTLLAGILGLYVSVTKSQASVQLKRHFSDNDKPDPELTTTVLSDPDPALIVLMVLLLFTLYWSVRGFIQLFQRHDSILVIFYLIFLFPIAYCHMLLLGMFGHSKAKRERSK